jgi:hypothetical protein
VLTFAPENGNNYSRLFKASVHVSLFLPGRCPRPQALFLLNFFLPQLMIFLNMGKWIGKKVIWGDEEMAIVGDVEISSRLSSGLSRFRFSQVREMILLFILLLAFPAYAEEPRVFTDDDLSHYKVTPMFDQETLAKREEELKKWEKERKAALLREKEEQERQKAEEMKKAIAEKQKQAAASNSKPLRGRRPST